MVEFFQNIVNWFAANKEEIALFFTSGSFATFVTMIVLSTKQIKAAVKSNTTVTGLGASLTACEQLSSSVKDIANSNTLMSRDVLTLKTQVDTLDKQLSESLSILQSKLNAILEVQAIVYSNVKDEKARKNILTILTTAKLSETAVIAELEKEIEELKLKVDTTMNDVKDVVEETTSKVKKVVSAKPTLTAPRYQR